VKGRSQKSNIDRSQLLFIDEKNNCGFNESQPFISEGASDNSPHKKAFATDIFQRNSLPESVS